MKRLRCCIYGAGREYNKLSSYLSLYKEKIEVVAIVTTKRQKFSVLDGIPCIRPDEMQLDMIDYIIIAVEKWKEVFDYLKIFLGGGIEEKIIRGSVFYLPNFNLEEYIKLKKSNLSILSNSCLGGRIYKELGLKTLTPTINALCKKGDYIEFLSRCNHYLKVDMAESCDMEYECSLGMYQYPKGIIDGEITWYFPHTIDTKTAVEKWNKKRTAVNHDNIAALMVIQSDEEAERFEELPIKRKLGVYYKDLHLKSVIYCPEWENEELRSQYGFFWYVYVHRYITNVEQLSRVDWIKFFNQGEDFLRY